MLPEGQGSPGSPAHLPGLPRVPPSPPYLLEAVVLLAVGAVPAVAVPVGHHGVLAAEPAVHCHVRGLPPVGTAKPGALSSADGQAFKEWENSPSSHSVCLMK